MITESTIYWITRLDNIHTALGILCGLSAVGSIIVIATTIGMIMDANLYSNEDLERVKTFVKYTIIVPILLVLFGIGVIFTPTTKEMCAIKVIPAIANNENVSQIGSEIMNLAKNWITELNPKTDKKTE